MRKIVALLITICLALVLAPLGMGLFAQKTVEEYLKVAAFPPGVHVEITDYHRGWFSSQAILTATLTELHPEITAPISVTGPLHIKHGPFVIDDTDPAHRRFISARVFASAPLQFSVKDQAQAPAWLSAIFSDKTFVHLSAKTGWLGSTSFQVFVPEMLYEAGTEKVAFGGLKGVFRFSANHHKIDSHIALQPITLQLPEWGALTTGQIALQGHSYQTGFDDMWLGNGSLEITHVEAAPKTGTPWQITGLVLQVGTEEHEKTRLNTTTSITAIEIRRDKEVYGPLNIHYTLEGLDLSALAQLQHYLAGVQQIEAAAVMSAEEQAQLNKHLLQLFIKGAIFDVERFTLDTPHGAFELTAEVSIPAFEPQNGAMSAPPELLQTAEATVKLTVSESLAKKVIYIIFAETISPLNQVLKHASPTELAVIEGLFDKETTRILDGLEQKKLITKDNATSYKANAHFKDGHFYINEQDIQAIDLKDLL